MEKKVLGIALALTMASGFIGAVPSVAKDRLDMQAANRSNIDAMNMDRSLLSVPCHLSKPWNGRRSR